MCCCSLSFTSLKRFSHLKQRFVQLPHRFDDSQSSGEICTSRTLWFCIKLFFEVCFNLLQHFKDFSKLLLLISSDCHELTLPSKCDYFIRVNSRPNCVADG